MSAQSTSARETLLSCHQVGLLRGDTLLFQGLDLQVQRGQIWAVLGENGVGKTSFLAAMAHYLPLDFGRVELFGQPIASYSALDRARILSWLPQQEPDVLSVTVLERVMLGRHPFVSRLFIDGVQDLRIAEDALADVGLAGYEHRLVRQLSGGERRRVSLAACLAQQAQLLLLDEPLAALDLRHQHMVLRRLNGLAQSGCAVVWITHDPNQALLVATHALLFMGDGQPPMAGLLRDVLTAQHLSRAYHCDVRCVAHDGVELFFVPPAFLNADRAIKMANI